MSQTNTANVVMADVVGGGYGEFWKFRGRYRVVKGSRASKKSKTTALNIIYRMMQYPYANTLVVRKTGNTLRDSCFSDLKWAAARLQVSHLWTFTVSPLGAEYRRPGQQIAQQIFFRGLDDPLKLASISCPAGLICWAWIEEAYELDSEEDFNLIDDVIRGEFPEGTKNGFKQLTLTFNPWTASSWIKARFFDAPPSPDVLAMTTTFRCNEWLDKADLERFNRMEQENPSRFRVAGLGEWGVEGATFFEEWRDDPAHYLDQRWTHVIEPFEIPADWKIYRGFDFGYARPFSIGWFACDHDGRLYHILELYGCTERPNEGVRWMPPKIFAEIKRIEEEHRWLRGKTIRGVADPSIWDASRGISVAETGEKAGVYFEPGDNHRIPGWMQMHYRFSFDSNGIPMMYVFRTCRQFIRTVPTLLYDDVHPEDIDTDLEDHIADMCRYVCMSRPINPRLPKPKKPNGFDPLSTDDYSFDPYALYRR